MAESLLFCDQSDLAGINYAAYLQKAGGTPPLRLGEGWPLDLSPDGKVALASVPSDPPRLFLYPTGAGEPREITIADFTAYGTGSFFPDGRSVLLCGAKGDQARRCFVRDLESGDVSAVTPEGTEGGLLLAGARAVLAKRTDGSWVRFALEGGAEETIAGLDGRDELIRVGSDGRSVLVYRPNEVPTAIERLDLATGERSLVQEIAPPNLVGVLRFWWVGVSAGESAYAYDYTRALGQIFEIEGLK